MQDYRKLDVWRKSHDLALEVYRLTKGFPHEERYGLTSQIRRAAVSINANIAEGCGRGGSTELARFLRIAQGSASELECELLLAFDLHFMNKGDHVDLARRTEEVKRRLASLTRKVTTSN